MSQFFAPIGHTWLMATRNTTTVLLDAILAAALTVVALNAFRWHFPGLIYQHKES
jgi:hypothetical protein